MNFKKTLCAMLVAGVPVVASAANWVDFIASEPADAPKARLFGFIQPVYTYYDAEPIQGFLQPGGTPGVGPYNPNVNGKHMLQNLVQPNFEETSQFQFLRAQMGVRGRINDKINYFLFTDFGQNLTTSEKSAMVTDASLTFDYIPGARIRAGLFKLPTGEEALVANPLAFSYVYYSLVTALTVQETFVRQVGNGSVNPPAGPGCGNIPGSALSANPALSFLSCGQAVAGNNAFRDWGIQVFDSFTKGNWELGYAAMISEGNEIENISDNDGNKDFTARLQLSYVFKGKGPMREDANVFIWRQKGERDFGGTDYDRIREGTGFRVTKGPYRASGEYIRAKGMVLGGPNAPVTNPGGPTEGDLIPPYNLLVSRNGKADGWYLEGGWRFHPDWEVNVRYDTFDRFTNDPASERVFNTWTLGGQYFINKASRVTLNYEWREQEVPNISSIVGGWAQANAQTVADSLADRISLQLTYNF